VTLALYATLAAGANVLGALVVASDARRSLRVVDALIGIAAGFMISVTLTELIPESLARGGSEAGVLILVGYLLVHFSQHTLARHFHFGEETHPVSRSTSISALAGLLVHTFVDGVAIASGFLVSERLGRLVVAAIVLHKLPEGLAIASLFLAAGRSRAAAIAAAGALGAATIAGIVLTRTVGPLERHGLALASGVTLYVAASSLVPEFLTKRGWRPAAYFFGGCTLYVAAFTLLR
jgi:zinc and cadmium transporter